MKVSEGEQEQPDNVNEEEENQENFQVNRKKAHSQIPLSQFFPTTNSDLNYICSKFNMVQKNIRPKAIVKDELNKFIEEIYAERFLEFQQQFIRETPNLINFVMLENFDYINPQNFCDFVIELIQKRHKLKLKIQKVAFLFNFQAIIDFLHSLLTYKEKSPEILLFYKYFLVLIPAF